jgi:ATP-binding cassette, subfamily B, bacterial PglK
MRLIGRENRFRWLLLILLALVSSGFELIGASLVYLLLALVADPSGQIELPIIGDPSELVAAWGDREVLLGLSVAMAAFFVLRAVVHVAESYAQSRVGYTAGAKLSTRLVQGYLAMPYTFHLNRNTSELVRNAYQAVEELVTQVFLPLIRVSAELVLVVSMLTLLVIIAPGPTGLAVLVIGSSAVLLLLVVQPRLKQLGGTAHRTRRETLSVLQQSLHGIRDVKVLGLEEGFSEIFGKGQRRIARATYLRATFADLPRTTIETALIGFILLLFAFAVFAGDDAAGLLSVLGLFAYAGLRLQPSLHRILAGLNNLKFAAVPLQDLAADLELTERYLAGLGPVPALPFTKSIELRGVEFRYEGMGRPALEDINLTIGAGEVIGVCGPTGGGKTTLIDVISGLLQPAVGHVLIDDQDLRKNERAWQRNLGIVPQMVFLMDDSLRRNIALGLPDDKIDDAAIQEAVRLAQLEGFVSSLHEGLDTHVGERGVRISGGQRQRIAIARALYHRPSVLIFDEGTSALDNTTEAELMSSLERLRGQHTILMIAHRLSTVQNCDRVVYLEAGRVAGLGTYEALAAGNPGFRRMAAK